MTIVKFNILTYKTMSVLNKLLVTEDSNKIINVINVKLEIKKSTIEGAGNGVFTCEDIKEGTIFFECIDFHLVENGNLDKVINDLAYYGTLQGYNVDKNIIDNTNVGYIVQYKDPIKQMFGGWPDKMYLYAIKDINKGNELSRHYGINYWIQHEFWKQFGNCKFRDTQKMEDLPSKYVFIDKILLSIKHNNYMNLFGKQIDNKYYYFVSNEFHNYMDPNFENMFKEKINVTKNDKSKYEEHEKIYNGMFLSKYLQKQKEDDLHKRRQCEKDFWDLHSYSKYKESKNISDLPTDYVLIDFLCEDPSVSRYQDVYDLYCKKIDDKYYYLRSITKHYEQHVVQNEVYLENGFMTFEHFSRQLDFDENNCIDCSKDDNSKYEEYDLIDNFTQLSHIIKLEDKKKEDRTEQRLKFLNKYNINESLIGRFGSEDLFYDVVLPDEYVPIIGLIKDGDQNLNEKMLYGKKVNNEYYYLMQSDDVKWWEHDFVNYYEDNFKNKIREYKDITKKDKSKYDMYEEFPENMHTRLYHDRELMNSIKKERKNKQIMEVVNTYKVPFLIGGFVGLVCAFCYYNYYFN